MFTSRAPRRTQTGLTFVELIMFIVIVGIAVAGVLLVLDVAVKSSADPMIRKNMLSIAEALLEEVELMPFTYCDPNDANASTAASTAGCATLVEGMGPDAGETRSDTANPFNNVNDYYAVGGLALPTPVPDISNTYFAPAGYSATIQIVAEDLNGIVSTTTPATMRALRIAVTVSHGSDSIVLEGYRTRHSPNFNP